MDTGSTFYVLMVGGALSVYTDAKSAIKALRDMMKADLTLQPESVVIDIVDLTPLLTPSKGAITALPMSLAQIVRGLTWTNADYPAVWP